MPSAYLNAALDGTDLGYNKAIVDAQMVVAQGGDRRTFDYDSPTGSYSYLGIARASFPRTYLNTDPMPACTGVVRNVTTDAEMATALSDAVANAALDLHDWIVVALGTYTGFYAPGVKQGDATPGGDGVCVIISKAVYDSIDPLSGLASVCPALKRVSDADVAASMPYFKNVSLANAEQWKFDGPTKGWRFVGIHFGADATVSTLGRLIRLGNGDGSIQSGVAACPQNIVLDRCGFNGHTTLNLKAAVELHGRSLAVQECYFGDEIHHDGSDCKAIISYNGPGPTRIVNNRLVASTENIMYGGAFSTPGCAPQDAEVRWNTFSKPLSWNPSHPTYAGKNWSVKNLVETKKLQWGLIEGNYLEHAWPEDQAGAAFLIKSESYGDGATNGYTHDVIVRWNHAKDIGYGINIAGVSNNDPAVAPQRVWSVGNLYEVGAQYFSANANPFIGTGKLDTCGSIHDTFIARGVVNAICQPAGGQVGLTFLDTIFDHTTYGVKGSGVAGGTPTFNAYCPGYDVRGCAFVGSGASSYPPGNFFPASAAAVGFVDYAGGNYALDGTSQDTVPSIPPATAPVLSSMQLVVPPSDGTSGLPLPTQPSIRMLDDMGALYVMNGTAAITVVSGDATITAGSTVPITNGVGSAAGLTLSAPAPTSVVLRITEPTSGLYVETGAIALDSPALTLTTPASDGVSGVPLPTQPVVQYRDALGNPIAQAGVVVTADVASSNGSVTVGASALTNAAGQAAFSGLTFAVPSDADLIVRYATPGAAPVEETVRVTVPASDPTVTALVCTRQPKGAKNGEPLRIEPRYEWQNAAGEVVRTCTAPVTLSVEGNATTIGTNMLHAIEGVTDFAGSGFGVSGRGKVTIIAEGTP